MKSKKAYQSLQRSITRLVGIKERLELAAEMNGLDPFHCDRCKLMMADCECTDAEIDEHFRDAGERNGR